MAGHCQCLCSLIQQLRREVSRTRPYRTENTVICSDIHITEISENANRVNLGRAGSLLRLNIQQWKNDYINEIWQ